MRCWQDEDVWDLWCRLEALWLCRLQTHYWWLWKLPGWQCWCWCWATCYLFHYQVSVHSPREPWPSEMYSFICQSVVVSRISVCNFSWFANNRGRFAIISKQIGKYQLGGGNGVHMDQRTIKLHSMANQPTNEKLYLVPPGKDIWNTWSLWNYKQITLTDSHHTIMSESTYYLLPSTFLYDMLNIVFLVNWVQ